MSQYPDPDRFVPTPAGSGAADADDDNWLERRVLPLEGGQNFRDLGGYPTEDGRRVRWGKLYRSGSMGGLTEADYNYLAKLNIRSVCDLRTPEEREAEPNHWVAAAGINYWSRDYTSNFGELRKLLASDVPTPEAARAAMMTGYRRLPFDQAPAYRAVFERLKAGEIPLVFNCSAGKDRAGTAAALLLSALGVPRETILADYDLTNRLLDPARLVPKNSNRDDSLLARISPEVIAAVLGAHPSYIGCALDVVEEKHGSMAAYLAEELAIDEGDIEIIRDSLLERRPD